MTRRQVARRSIMRLARHGGVPFLHPCPVAIVASGLYKLLGNGACFFPLTGAGVQDMAENFLYYGDNLDILHRYIKDESVDLIYLDPPFNSNATYNVLFAEKNGSQAASQIKAFEDTWHWDEAAARLYQEVVLAGGRVSQVMQAFRQFLGDNDMLAYLTMMAPRLVELRRVLKPTGSIYLHCDPTASHYLKLLMDAVFGPENFRNEIVWKRTISKSLMTRRLPVNHDTLLAYQKSGEATWNREATIEPYDADNLDERTANKYRHRGPDGRLYMLDSLINPNPDRPNLTYEFMGVTRVWRWTRERMESARQAGLIVQTRPGNVPRLKRYLDEQKGRALGDVWTDIAPINSQARERLGYPTQKPEALLERIIKASSNEGDVVLDPFCGCGTAVVVAQRLNRRWIGIDITYLAVALIKNRLRDAFGEEIMEDGQMVPAVDYKEIGAPVSVPDAEALARQDPHEFQHWAVGRVSAWPMEEKKGRDRGIDGRIYFHDEPEGKKTKQIILQVKGGHTGPAHVRDLMGVIEREKAEIGVLITLQESTRDMRSDAASAGFYKSPVVGQRDYPRLQLLTVRELLDGKQIDYPHETSVTFKKAPKAKRKGRKAKDLFEGPA